MSNDGDRSSTGDSTGGQQAMNRGELFILSAPSGTGKTTLIRSLLLGRLGRFGDIAFAVSHTTRRPRGGEEDGQDYHFVATSQFEEMIAGDRFLEWAEVHNNYYGTSLDEVIPRLEQGMDVLMDIDVQGTERVMSRFVDPTTPPLLTEVHSIFIMPPSYHDLEERLQQRSLDDPQEISRRLAVATWEMKRYDKYHYVIINDDAEEASHILASIILEKRHRRDRMRIRAQQVLRDFMSSAGRTTEGEEEDAG
jgi:guanylate kinase